MRSNVRERRQAGAEIVDRLAIAAHVGVIDVGAQAQDAYLFKHQGAVKLELHGLGVRATEIGVKMSGVGDLGHKSLGETRDPRTRVTLDHGPERKSSGCDG